MSGQFAGKVVAVTGAAGGIGRALCRLLASEGASIAALDRSDKVMDFVEELRAGGAKAAGVVVDIVDSKGISTAFAELRAALGPIDVLVNNAGISNHPKIALTSPEQWESDVASNLNGAYNCIHAVLPGMVERKSGSIINVSSVNGLTALGDPAYSAAKAGMVALTKAVAVEYGPVGIRANTVLPGTVRSPIWDERSKKNPKVLETLARWYPLGRIVEPLEVAKVIAFLASDAASAVTGVALPVDCGLMAGNGVMASELTVEGF
ncbi:SDR family oxidoreductase [Devosia sp.]|uniref:SDR family oxidoreductase n=1 Tax=Devosia sp. TaxID=1871048 RepID=UPI003BA9D805